MAALLLLSTGDRSVARGWSAVDARVRASRGRGLWDGPEPARELSPSDVIRLTLHAMQHNPVPVPHSGTALLLRFSTPDLTLAGIPRPVCQLTPAELTASFGSSQYNLLLAPDMAPEFPSDMISLDGLTAFQEVSLLAADDSAKLATLGWELCRVDGCWLTSGISWHDFREGWRPGIGQEEWDRSFG